MISAALFTLLFCAASANYLVEWRWNNAGCQANGNPLKLTSVLSDCIVSGPGAYNATGCVCNVNDARNCSYFECRSVSPTMINTDNGLANNVPSQFWQTTYPPKFSFRFEKSAWNNAQCLADPDLYQAWLDESCVSRTLDIGVTVSDRRRCTYSGRTSSSSTYYFYQYNYNLPSCNGALVSFAQYSQDVCSLEVLTNQYTVYHCSAPCFHESTEITYRGEKHSLLSLQKNPLSQPCAVPHVVITDGVKISTSCSKASLRLSNTHLVYTSKGLVRAVDVEVGDHLFADMNENTPCQVLSIEKEIKQKYFGLNCEDSDVLADGYKTSTFGDYHTVPATWMKYGSKVLGVHTASAIGDFIASIFYSF